ncbi:hypothetical protein EDB89DRAFT_565909 [Lactarius sanguifluus]|nr:hypothetical protein EDB89DRAFT_565909 [Lactarius sanguifluus]
MGTSTIPLPLPESLDLSEADVIVRTSDLTTFLAHKSVLASSSWVFRDMFTLPWPPNNEMVNGLPVVDISEDAGLVRSLITMLYPIPSELPASYDSPGSTRCCAEIRYGCCPVLYPRRGRTQTATYTGWCVGFSCVCHREQQQAYTGNGNGGAPHSGQTYEVRISWRRVAFVRRSGAT